MVMRKSLILIPVISLFLYSCLDEETLSVDALYSEDIIEEFTIFDPCDTISGPDYQVTRALSVGSEIERLFHFTHPLGEALFIGRSLENNTDFDKRQLFFQGLTIVDNLNSNPTFVLLEDNTGVQGFENVFLIAQQGSLTSNYLLGTSSNALTAAISAAGDAFKVNLYEIRESNENITITNFLRLNATSGASAGQEPNYNYNSSTPPSSNSQAFQEIENFITLIRSGMYPFDAQAQAKKFDLQLGVIQRDFQFAQGLIQDDLINQLTMENQNAIQTLTRFINGKIISSLRCLTDEQAWSVTEDVGSDISSALD